MKFVLYDLLTVTNFALSTFMGGDDREASYVKLSSRRLEIDLISPFHDYDFSKLQISCCCFDSF